MALGPQTQRDQILVVVAAAGILAAGAYGYLLYMPERAELATIEARVQTLDSLNALAKTQMGQQRIDAMRADAERSQKALEAMRQLVPTGNEVPALLEQVSDAARRAGLEIGKVEPQPVLEGDQFDTYRYKIGVAGSYHRIAQFITNVGSLTRIMAPVNLHLDPLQNANASKLRDKPGEQAINAEFELQTYVVKQNAKKGPRA